MAGRMSRAQLHEKIIKALRRRGYRTAEAAGAAGITLATIEQLGLLNADKLEADAPQPSSSHTEAQ